MAVSTLHFVNDSQVKLKEKLSTSGYTNEYVLKKLYDNNKEFVKLLGDNKLSKLTAHDISEGKGYCSRVFKTTVHWDAKNGNQSYTVVIKVPSTDNWSEMHVDFTEADKENNKKTIRQMHNAECNAYELAKDLKNFPKPEIYYIERATPEVSGMIMMNDLSGKGASLGVFFGVTQQHCFNLAKHMAEFQAYVDFLPGKKWKGKFTENLHAKSDIEEIWKKMIVPITTDYEDKELAEKAKVLLKLDALRLGRYCTESRAKEIGCDTLCHGDMWTNNMLIQLSEDGSVSDQILAIIDWQTFFEGNPLFDIARFISNCADADVRRECEYKVVDSYYDLLTEKYKQHGEKLKFTREQAYELYELGVIQQTLLMAIMFSLLGLPLKDSKIGAEQAKLKKLALRMHLLYDDAVILMEKYGIQEKFTLK